MGKCTHLPVSDSRPQVRQKSQIFSLFHTFMAASACQKNSTENDFSSLTTTIPPLIYSTLKSLTGELIVPFRIESHKRPSTGVCDNRNREAVTFPKFPATVQMDKLACFKQRVGGFGCSLAMS